MKLLQQRVRRTLRANTLIASLLALSVPLVLATASSNAYAGDDHKNARHHHHKEGRNVIRDRKVISNRQQPAKRSTRHVSGSETKKYRERERRHIPRESRRQHASLHDRQLDHYRHRPRYNERRHIERKHHDRKRRHIHHDRHVIRHRPYYRSRTYLGHRPHGHARIDRFHYHGHYGHRHWGHHSHRHPGSYFGASIVLGDFYAHYDYDEAYPAHRRQVNKIYRSGETYYLNRDGSCYVEDIQRQRKVMVEVDPEYCEIDRY